MKNVIVLLVFFVSISCSTSKHSEDAFFECVEQNLNSMDDYDYRDFLSSMNAVEAIILDFEKSSSVNNKVALNFVESLKNQDVIVKIQQLSLEDYTGYKVISYDYVKSCVIEIAELHSLQNSELLKSQLELHNIVDYKSTLEIKDLRNFVASNDLTLRNNQILFYYWVYMYSNIKQLNKQ